MAWHWEDAHALDGAGAADPWLEWRRHRRPHGDQNQLLCERDQDIHPESMRQRGWQVPAAYDDDARYFTARCPAPGACGLPPVTPAQRNGRGPRFEGGNDRLWREDGLRLAAASLLSKAASPEARTRRDVVGSDVDARRPPVIGIIDAHVAFLHKRFRLTTDLARTRIRAHWDQQTGSATDGPWHVPPVMGYGRELLGTDINKLVGNERETYSRLGVSAPAWSHGTQMCSLAITGGGAANCPIVTVSLPGAAFVRTHGRWLNVYLLDGLRFILSHAQPNEPVIVNVSLGAHSGPHDGSSLLEEAIDDLIAQENGRLTVVIAAGNSRLARVRARGPLSGTVGSNAGHLALPINVASDDPRSNFVEAWCEGDASSFRFQITPPDAIGLSSPSIASGQCSALLDDEGLAVAMVCALPPVPPRKHFQALMAVAPASAVDMPGLGTALGGPWTLRVTGPRDSLVEAWIVRNDTDVYGRRTMSFAGTIAPQLLQTEGTMSGLCGAKLPVVVGGYELERNGHAKMYEHSGEGFAEPERGRVAPDLCAMAHVSGAAIVGFLSDEKGNLPGEIHGTSVAAPLALNALAHILHERGPLPRDTLLAELKLRHESLPIQPMASARWTSDYWLAWPPHASATSAAEDA